MDMIADNEHVRRSRPVMKHCGPKPAADIYRDQNAADRKLIDRIAEGDKGAMQQLFTRYNVAVYRFVLRSLKDPTLAQDVAGDVFLAVWRHAARLEDRSNVSAWIFAIARNTAITELRRRNRHFALDEAEAVEIPDPTDNAEIVLQKDDRATILRRCLGMLSPDHRTVLDLIYFHDKSVDEVADIIGVPRNTVKTRTLRARKHMSSLLGQAGLDQAYA